VDFLAKPSRANGCMNVCAFIWGAEFEYADPQPAADWPSLWEAGRLPVWPEELCARLATAAELHSTTVVEILPIELRQLGPGAEQLAEHIRHLMRSYDMTAFYG